MKKLISLVVIAGMLLLMSFSTQLKPEKPDIDCDEIATNTAWDNAEEDGSDWCGIYDIAYEACEEAVALIP